MFRFEKKESVVKVSLDLEKAKSLFEASERTFNFAEENKLKLENSGVLISNYYESLIELLHSHACKKGYKISDHITFSEYISEIFLNKTYSELFDKSRKIRNKVIYYGKITNLEIAKQAIKDIKEIIKFIKNNFEK